MARGDCTAAAPPSVGPSAGRRTTVADLGERAIINWLRSRRQRKPRSPFRLETGIGDDAAVVSTPGRERLILTCDQLVQDVHYNLPDVTAADVGWKAAAVTISDIAAMGGRPLYLMVSIAMHGAVDSRWIRRFYDGFLDAARKHGACLIGGDTSASPGPTFVDVMGVGACRRPVLRSGARPGDGLYVSRTLGDSAAGLLVLRSHLRFPELRLRHLRPEPEIALGAALADRRLASAMLDMSDGLSRDLRNLCEASGCGAEIDLEALPISPELERFCTGTGVDTADFALHGGEDYGLLFAMRPSRERALGALSRRVHRIGTITQRGLRLRRKGRGWENLPDETWKHFGERT